MLRWLIRFLLHGEPVTDWRLYEDSRIEYLRQVQGGKPTAIEIQAWNNRDQGNHGYGKWFEY